MKRNRQFGLERRDGFDVGRDPRDMSTNDLEQLGQRRDPEQVRREGWHEQRMLAVSLDDYRLTWPERELVRQLGEKLYGKLPAVREVRHD